MPQDIQKPEALIEKEGKIFSEWSVAKNKAYSEWSGAKNKAYSEWSGAKNKAYSEWTASGKTDEGFAKAKEIDNAAFAKAQGIDNAAFAKAKEIDNATFAKAKKEQKAAWVQYGWSQEQEDAYRQQEADKWKAAHPDPVKAEPKPKPKGVAKPAGESPRVISQRQEIKEAILDYFDAGMFDSKENLLAHIKQLDTNAPHINVVVSEDGERAVSVSSNGKIVGFNGVKLHPMGARENDLSTALEAVKKFVKEHDFKGLSEERMLEIVTNGATEIRDDKGNKLTAIILNDHKHVLVANEQGGYEVLDVKPEASLPAPAGTKPVTGTAKTK